VIKRVNGGRETTMEAKDLGFDERGQREVVKQVGEGLPHICTPVLAQALIIKAVLLSDLS
jgi:hypothetical protein